MSELQTPEEGTEQEAQTPQTEVEETTQNENQTETNIETEAETPQEPVEAQTSQTETATVPKDKFVASQRESILNAARVEAAQNQIEQLTKTDTPTDEAMRLVYPEWDDLNEVTKKALINQEAQNMRQNRIEARQLEIDNRQKLEDELERVITSNPKLSGKEAEFKRFAKNPKNKGIDAETLAKAFLFDVEPQAPTATAPSEALPVGSGGPRESTAPKKISAEEAKSIRETDFERWRQLANDGLIDDEL